MKVRVPSNGNITPTARKSSARIISFSNSARYACGKGRLDPNSAYGEMLHAGENLELSPWFGESGPRAGPRAAHAHGACLLID